MADLTSRKEEYNGFKIQKGEERRKIADERSELANFIAMFELKEAVLYKKGNINQWLIIVKDCGICLRENIGIMCNFIPGMSRLAKRSTPDLDNFSKDEISKLLEFIKSNETQICRVLSLHSIGESFRWSADVYEKYYLE
ncbi:MAG: hypothetical protein WC788_04780 [Candidatus Paceibacterota bacterium]|jgi:hypothetical protein